jgi:hypothetical protein
MDVKTPIEALKKTGIDLKEVEAHEHGTIADCQQVSHKKTGAMGILIRLGKYDKSTIVHECIHAATMIIEGVGMDAMDNHAEPIAYLTEWLVKMVESGYYKKKVDFYK